MGNFFRSGCQNHIKPMAKIFRVPTNSACFPLRISVKGKRKKGFRARRCPMKKTENRIFISETSAVALPLTRFRGLSRVPGVAHPWTRLSEQVI